jgi:hypothetical protein
MHLDDPFGDRKTETGSLARVLDCRAAEFPNTNR